MQVTLHFLDCGNFSRSVDTNPKTPENPKAIHLTISNIHCQDHIDKLIAELESYRGQLPIIDRG